MDFRKRLILELKNIYNKQGKHSHYQDLPNSIKKLIKINVKTKTNRYEKERFDYVISNINIKNKKILDIGCNAGFFTFESIFLGAKKVVCYEGNKNLFIFVDKLLEILNLQSKIKVKNKYFNFSTKVSSIYDVCFLLNVLHHVGADFGKPYKSKEESLTFIKKALVNLSYNVKILVFQMGFNWKGDINFPFFETGTKKEMIRFIKNAIRKYWVIKKIGIASMQNNRILYTDLNKENIKRIDSLGEFLNRPIFILESKRIKTEKNYEY